MKATVFAGLLTSLVGAMVACSSAETIETKAQPDTPPAPAEDAGTTPDGRVTPTSCSAPLVDPSCPSTKPAPSSKDAIEQFVKDGAVPLRCDGSSSPVWDLRPLVQLYGDQKIFAVGEVHGSNEIGIVSSLLLEQLATQKLVNVLAFEMPMDTEEPLQRWVDGQADPAGEQIVKFGAKNFFGSILTRTARELKSKGIELRVASVDIPYEIDIAVKAIQDVAAKLTTQKDTVTATLPTTPNDVAKVNAYFDHIMAKKADICAELSVADCDRLVAMTHALWATANVDDMAGDQLLWFQRREVAIYYNMHAKMTEPTDRMFLHMGAAHTNKEHESAGSRMAKEWPLTKGKVFSIAPAWGNGSVIWYGRDEDLPGEPQTVVDALSQDPAHPFFVSTTRPSASCEANPLGEEQETSIGGGTRGAMYDGYIHYGRLTSEKSPSGATLSREDEVLGKGLAAFRARIERRERAALSAARLGARGGLGR